MLPIILYITNIYMIYYMNTSYQNQFSSSHIYTCTIYYIYIYTHDSLTFTNHHPLPFFTTSFLL